MIINAASSCWSGLTIQDAVKNIIDGKTYEPLLGTIAPDHVQICPQHINYFDGSVAEELAEKYPNTQFRLHADVRLKNKRGVTIDLSDYSSENEWYFKELAAFGHTLNSKFYSLHAGKRQVSFEKFKNQYLQVQEIFGDIAVCVEGLYPAVQSKWLIDKWEEYSWLKDNNIPYAIDLSHLKIVAKRYGQNTSLVKELVADDLCKEIHISFNNGIIDSHDIAGEQFTEEFCQYKEILECKNQNTVIFTEGNQVLHEIKQKRLLEKSR